MDKFIIMILGNILWWFNKMFFIRRFKKNGVHEIYRLKWILLDVEPEGKLAEKINDLIKTMEEKIKCG